MSGPSIMERKRQLTYLQRALERERGRVRELEAYVSALEAERKELQRALMGAAVPYPAPGEVKS